MHAAAPRSAAQKRIIDAALVLFADRGVSGTSLQMIADSLGVTKAAVYHQFNTKEAIILAAMEEPFARLASALEAAEAEEDPARGSEVLLAEVIDLTVSNRQLIRTMEDDPTMVRLVAAHEEYHRLRGREHRLLTGGRDTEDARIRAAFVISALTRAAAHPLVEGIDDATLARRLGELAREVLQF